MSFFSPLKSFRKETREIPRSNAERSGSSSLGSLSVEVRNKQRLGAELAVVDSC